MLHNLEHGGKPTDPYRLETSKALQALKRSLGNSSSWDKIVRIVDEAVENNLRDDITELTWCCTGSMLGESSRQPHGDITYLWEKVQEKLGEERLSVMAVGMLVQWRISLRKEEWYCNRVDTGEWDSISDMPIYYYQYWIKPE